MEPETHRGPELQQDAEGQLVFTGRPASGKLRYIGLGASLFWAVISVLSWICVVAAVGFITIRQPGTEPVVQTVPASQVPVMQLAILLFVLTGSTLGGGVYALFAWQWYLRRDNRVMTVSGVVWLMFIGPAVAAIIGFIMFGLARANVVPDDMCLGTPQHQLVKTYPLTSLQTLSGST